MKTETILILGIFGLVAVWFVNKPVASRGGAVATGPGGQAVGTQIVQPGANPWSLATAGLNDATALISSGIFTGAGTGGDDSGDSSSVS
jgi:hypothetical protein